MKKILCLLLLTAFPAMAQLSPVPVSTKLLSPKHTEHLASLGKRMRGTVDAPAQPQLSLTWDYPADQMTNVVFELYHATELSQGPPLSQYDQIPIGFTLLSVVTAPPVSVGGLAAEFFIVRARDITTGIVSNWNQP